MAMPMYKIRIIANACITRYDGGERSMNQIIASYNLAVENADLVRAEILKKKPNLDFDDMTV